MVGNPRHWTAVDCCTNDFARIFITSAMCIGIPVGKTPRPSDDILFILSNKSSQLLIIPKLYFPP